MDAATLAVAIPLLAAAVIAATVPLSPGRLADVVSLAAATAVAVLCAVVLDRAGDSTQVVWLGAWQPQGGVSLGISFAIDSIGAGVALLTAVLVVAALVFALRYLVEPDPLFHVLMLVFLAAMVGFAFSGDLFNLFVFFELMGIAAFVLAGYQIEQRAPLEGSLNFAVTNGAGSFFLLSGIGLVYGRTGALNLAEAGQRLSGSHADALVAVAFALIVCGFLVKAAIVPFHFWLADAYAVARTPVCIVFAGAMSELGLYGVARVYWTVFSGTLGPGEEALRAILVAAGVITALLGATMALAQSHLKRLLAFVTVAYLGLFLVGIGLLNADGLAGAALFVIGDGFLKAALFVGIGLMQRRFQHVYLGPLHGAGRELPVAGATFALAALGVASLPPFGSFVGKSLIEHGASAAGYDWTIAVFIAVSAICGAALLQAAVRIFLGLGKPRRSEGFGTGPEEEEMGEEPAPAPRGAVPLMRLTLLVLVGAALAVGVWPGLADSTVRAAERFLDRSAYVRTILHGAGGVRPAASAPPAEWFDYLYAAVSVALAGGLAALLVARATVADALPAALRRPLTGLRALHSGHPGDYVAFLTLGAALLAGLFALCLA